MTTHHDHHLKNIRAFRSEISPVKHSVQFYIKEETFLYTLGQFVYEGLISGECVIVLANPAHRMALEKRLAARGLNLAELSEHDQYIALDARETLARFMGANRPDERRFKGMVSELLTRAYRNGRSARMFGEMVALLWAGGNREATLQLERLWHQFCEEKNFRLFCAYPKSDFRTDITGAIAEICALHSSVVSGVGD